MNLNAHSKILRTTVSGTCAVCAIAGDPRKYIANPAREALHIIGTGFLVRRQLAITNRHVIEAMLKLRAEWALSEGNFYLWFAYPNDTGGWHEAYCVVQGQVVADSVDIGFIRFSRRPEPGFEQCQPLPVVDVCQPDIGLGISVCGFPYGTEGLRGVDGRIERVGPVVQQGFVSALAPFDLRDPSMLRGIVLDARTAGGMSGAAVVRNEDGHVLGVHYAGIESTLAIAEPIDQLRLNQWLADIGEDKSP